MAISIAQTNTNSAISATSITATFGSNTTTGNAILVALMGNGGRNITGISDGTNTYVKIDSTSIGPGVIDGELWWSTNITGATTPTISVTMSGVENLAIVIREYSSGAPLTLDAHKVASSSSGTALSSGASASTTQANEIVIGYGGANTTGTYLVGSGYGNLVTATGTSVATVMEDKSVSATGAQTATFTSPATSAWVCGVATFYEGTGSTDLNANTSDSTSTSEAVDMTSVQNTDTSDTTTTSESVGYYSELVATREQITISVSAPVVDFQINVSDSTTTSEAVQLLIPTSFVVASDTINTSEALKAEVNSFIKTSDTFTTNEAIAAIVPNAIVRSDSITTTENVSVSVSVSITVSDTITTAEATTLLEPNLYVNTLDTANSGEALILQDQDGLVAMDSITTTENVQLLIPTLFIATSDSTSTSESTGALLPFYDVAISDNTTTAEAVTVLDQKNIVVNDATTTSENTQLLIPTLFVNRSDSVSTAENVNVASEFNIHRQPDFYQDGSGVRII